MVTTRSGRSLFCSQEKAHQASSRSAAFHKKPSRVRSAQTSQPAGLGFVILEDPSSISTPVDQKASSIAVEDAKEAVPSNKPLTFSKPPLQPNRCNDENTNTINRARPAFDAAAAAGAAAGAGAGADVVKTIKVISMSDSERSMNGAPEGALYDAVITEDDQLPSFPTEEEANSQLQASLQTYRTTSVWAEKFEAVVTMRRCLRHFPAVIRRDLPALDACLDACLDSSLSLRSTSAKNGLLFIQALLPEPALAAQDRACKVATGLANRLASTGPRFLLDFAFAVAEQAARILPSVPFATSLKSSLAHRNAEVSRKAGVLVLHSAKKLLDPFFQRMTPRLDGLQAEEVQQQEEGVEVEAASSSLSTDVCAVFPVLVDCVAKVANQAVVQTAASALSGWRLQASEVVWTRLVHELPEDRRKALDRALLAAEAKRQTPVAI